MPSSLPAPRGALSAHLIAELTAGPPRALPAAPPVAAADPLGDDDLHLALYLCYELHYRGLAGVDERWEWDPGLLALRAALEEPFEAALREVVPMPAPPGIPARWTSPCAPSPTRTTRRRCRATWRAAEPARS